MKKGLSWIVAVVLLACPFGVWGQANVISADSVDIPPQFPGGGDALYRYLTIETPYSYFEETVSVDQPPLIIPDAYVQFVVDTMGNVGRVIMIQGIEKRDFNLKAFNLVKTMPRWKPAIKNGKPVSVSLMVPIKSSLVQYPYQKSLNDIKQYIDSSLYQSAVVECSILIRYYYKNIEVLKLRAEAYSKLGKQQEANQDLETIAAIKQGIMPEKLIDEHCQPYYNTRRFKHKKR